MGQVWLVILIDYIIVWIYCYSYIYLYCYMAILSLHVIVILLCCYCYTIASLYYYITHILYIHIHISRSSYFTLRLVFSKYYSMLHLLYVLFLLYWDRYYVNLCVCIASFREPFYYLRDIQVRELLCFLTWRQTTELLEWHASARCTLFFLLKHVFSILHL